MKQIEGEDYKGHSTKSIKSNKSIKFNKTKEVFVYENNSKSIRKGNPPV